MQRLLLALLLGLAAVPAAAQGEEVDLLDARLPPLVVAGVPFDANVTLANRADEPRTAYLYAVLYAPDGGGPCGGQTSPRWRGVVSMSPGVAQLQLAPGEARTYPDPGRAEGVPPRWIWAWNVNESWVPAEDEYEVCVFAMAEAGAALRDAAQHYDFLSTTLRVRPTNAAPVADFSVIPPVANATTPFTFRATATDPDGDPVTYAWDFGHHNAAGRATARGPVVEHRFWPAGTYTVTLRASDPFATTTVAREVTVLPEEEPTPPFEDATAEERGLPALGAVAVAVAAAAVARGRRP